MDALRSLYRKWSSGFVDQTRHHADADVVSEYERSCERYGENSEAAMDLRPHAEAVYERRREEVAREKLLQRQKEE